MGSIKNFIEKIKSARYGKDVRQSIVDAIEQTYSDAISNGHTDMEVAKARNMYNDLNSRLEADKNKMEEKIKNEGADRKEALEDIQKQVNGLASGSPLVAESISEMTDNKKVYVNTTDGHWYYFNGTTWIDGGVYQGIELEDGSVTVEKTNFARNIIEKTNNILDLNNLIKGKVIKSWSTSTCTTSNYLIDNTNGYATKIIEVNGGEIYKTVQEKQTSYRTCHIMQFDTDGKCISYTEAVKTFEILNNAKYVAFSFPTSSAIPDAIVRVDNTEEVPVYVKYGYELKVPEKKALENYINKKENLENSEQIIPNSYVSTNGLTMNSTYYNRLDVNLRRGQTIEVWAVAETNVCILALINSNKDFIKNIQKGNGIDESNYETYRYTANTDNELISISFYKPLKCKIKLYYSNSDKDVINNSLTNIENDYLKTIFNSVACLGDSLTEGYLGSNTGMARTPYPKALSKMMNCDVINYGHSGSTVISYWNNYAQDINYKNHDVVIIGLGTNAGLTATLEEDTNYDNYNNYAETNTGCYCKIIEYIKEQNPRCKIFICNVGYANSNSEDTVITNNVLKEIAKKYSLPYLEVYGNSFYTLAYHSLLLHPLWNTSGDILHFSNLGYTIYAKVILHCITEYISKNPMEFRD